jgi:probable HAF family extracellular repeat protein
MKVAMAISGVFSVAATTAAQTPGFWLVGTPPGGTNSAALALSQDGRYAAGYTEVPPTQSPGFRWSVSGGREDFGLLPGMPMATFATAMSSSGSVLGGTFIQDSTSRQRAFRRVGEGPIENLGILSGRTESYGLGISGDGSAVVGYCYTASTNFGEAFRWTETGGMQGIGYLRPNGVSSRANAISRDGTTIVGDSQSNGHFTPTEAFVWTQSGGMQGLPLLPGSPYPETYARAVSANGSVIVGAGETPSGHGHAVRWEAGVALDLGTVGDRWFSTALAVSDDGSVIGGTTSGGGPPDTAFVWTSPLGMISLADYLSIHGISMPSSFLPQQVDAISGDGLTFAGYGRNTLTGHWEGFVATVPSPGSAVFLLAPLFACRRRRVVS